MYMQAISRIGPVISAGGKGRGREFRLNSAGCRSRCTAINPQAWTERVLSRLFLTGCVVK